MKLLKKLREAYGLGRLLSKSELEFLKSMNKLTESGFDGDPRKLFVYTKYTSIRNRVLDEMERIGGLERASFGIGRVIPYFKIGPVI